MFANKEKKPVKLSDFKDPRLTLREKMFYWKRRSERMDKMLLEAIAQHMKKSTEDPLVVQAFTESMPEESRLKNIANVAKELKLPMSDPMVMCRYWRKRALATRQVLRNMTSQQKKVRGCIQNGIYRPITKQRS